MLILMLKPKDMAEKPCVVIKKKLYKSATAKEFWKHIRHRPIADTSPNKELVDDLVSIIHVFSCRLYGLRKYKKKLQGDTSLKGGEKYASHAKSKAISESDNEESAR